MHENPEVTENDVEQGLIPEQTEVDIPDLLFSDTVSSLCYWGAILLLAIVGAHLIPWDISHAAHYVIPPNDFWGVTTPPWLVAPLAPIGMLLSLGHAAWSALCGRRTWRMVMAAAGLILVMASSRLLEAPR
jgi:hypothetical protein